MVSWCFILVLGSFVCCEWWWCDVCGFVILEVLLSWNLKFWDKSFCLRGCFWVWCCNGLYICGIFCVSIWYCVLFWVWWRIVFFSLILFGVVIYWKLCFCCLMSCLRWLWCYFFVLDSGWVNCYLDICKLVICVFFLCNSYGGGLNWYGVCCWLLKF